MYSPWLNTLNNGIRSLFWESPFTRIATVQCFFPGGKRLESPRNAGISQLIAHQLLLDHHDFLEELGSAITVEVEADYFVISGKCLGEDLGELLTFLGNLLPRIHFNSHTLAKVKTEFIDRINEQQYNPFHCAYEQLQPLIYGNHPYGLDAWGTIESLDLLQIEDLQQHYDRFLSPRHLTVAITANSAPDRVGALVASAFGHWSSVVAAPILEHQAADFHSGIEHHPWEGAQTWLMVAFPAPTVHDRDFFAMKIINAHLGNGSSSQLFQVLREQKGLVYDVSTHCPTRFDRSHLLIHCTTDSDLQLQVKELILHETDRLQDIPLNNEALELAKSKLLGHYALAKQTTAQLAHINGWYHTLQLPPDFDFQFVKQIEQTTAQQIQAVAQKYLATYAVSIVG